MSNRKDANNEQGQGSGKESVGDILRKERITRRITVETIAKDLKINVNYIKALESSDYDALPAEPYIRVYLKSLTKYLSLDSESLLQQFHIERGIIKGTEYKKDHRIEISMREQQEKKNPTIIIAIVLIVVLAIFAFIADQQGWITNEQYEPLAIEEEMTEPIVPVSVEASEDSVIAAMNAPEEFRDTSVVKRVLPRP